MKVTKINIENKEYLLDIEHAKQLGVIKEVKKEYTLTLNFEQGEALRYLLGNIGGDTVPRWKCEEVWSKLCDLGFTGDTVRNEYGIDTVCFKRKSY